MWYPLLEACCPNDELKQCSFLSFLLKAHFGLMSETFTAAVRLVLMQNKSTMALRTIEIELGFIRIDEAFIPGSGPVAGER